MAWTKPDVKGTLNGEAVELTSYMDYLHLAYPTKGEDAEKNKIIHEDRILSFARPGGQGAKFKNLQEKMLRALNLPKGAKEELDYPPELAEKIQKGEPLWDEEKAKDGDAEEESVEDDDEKK